MTKIGYGDEILGSGLSKGAFARGKRIAFGDGRKILWAQTGELIYRNNPNIAPPGSEGSPDLEWVPHYKHHRIYFHKSTKGNAWEYDPNFRAQPGEIFFDKSEHQLMRTVKPGFILIEPFVKSCYPNKKWPIERYRFVAKSLLRAGLRVCQFMYDWNSTILYPGVTPIQTKTFRHALAFLSQARVFIGPEGGLAHGAAALGVRSVVLFGGFTDPRILGYPNNVNLTGGAEPCGSLASCSHCKEAMSKISVAEVVEAALGVYNGR